MTSSTGAKETEVAASLLAYLRRALRAPDLAYAEAPSPITGGFDTLIYAFRVAGAQEELSGPLILRVFRQENGPERACFERAVQNAVVGLGYPAPRVLLAGTDEATLGRAFVIMERLPGRIMLDLFFRPAPLFFRLPRLFAEQHARLHSVDPQPLLRSLEAAGFPTGRVALDGVYDAMQERIERAQSHWLWPAMQWLLDHRPSEGQPVICHGDFHPLNLLVHKGAVTGVIDWSWVAVAEPAYDVGATIALFTQGPVDLPGFLLGTVGAIRRSLIQRYLRAYQELRPIDPQAIDYFEALRCLGFLVEASEHWQADAGVIERPVKPSAFTDARIAHSTIHRLRELTGVVLEAPPAVTR